MATNPQDIFGTLGQTLPMSLPKAAPFGQPLFMPQAGQPTDPTAPGTNGAAAPGTIPASGSPASSSVISYMRDVLPNDQLQQPAQERVISKMGPDTELHRDVLQKLNAMFDFSETEMKKHHTRWNYAEQRIQAWTSLTDYEAVMRGLENTRAGDGLVQPPEPISVIVPYAYATLHAAATFIAQVLLGRKPVFPILAVRGTETERARLMEVALQSNLDASRGQETLWQFACWDPLVYGFGAAKNAWEEREGQTIRWIAGKREMSTETTFAGNVVTSIDPYAFRPDPRVPIHECNLRGDFMFCVESISESILKDLEKDGVLKWVDAMISKDKTLWQQRVGDENRRRLKIGIRGEALQTPVNVVGFHQVREGTVRLVPKDWKLGDSDHSELWKFTFTKQQIIQAEPLGMIHNMHPMVATEPASFGHDFMSISMHDMIGPFQDILSWLVSSRMENVRASINNTFAADPARIEINDIRSSVIGRIIRLKQTAMGLPIKDAIMQIMVQDVTAGHVNDIQVMRILADTITGVNDNMRGIQTAGGRRSATEARVAMQNGASRLSQYAIRASGQAFQPLCNQQILNIQQFMPDRMWLETTGDDGMPDSRAITPDMIVGQYNYQVSDGTLPYDNAAMLETWKEIMFGVAQDPELRQTWSIPNIFAHVAVLGGAKNIDSFKRQQLPAQPGLPPGAPTVGGNPFVAGAAADPSAMPNHRPLALAAPARPL
jgi:hypothetical protein